MKFKYLATFLFFALSLSMFTSCQKDNLDETVNGDNENPVVVVTCNWQMVLTHDGFGLLSTAGGGGTEPFTYEWSTGETTETITVTDEGTYSLTVTDAEECVVEDEITVTFADPCENMSANITNSGSGVLVASANGGTEPYSYSWSTGETTASITVTADGTYTVTATDAVGCEFETSITVTVTDPCASLDVVIEENPGGVLTAIGTGGSSPYTYLWSTGATTQSISPNIFGTYTVTVTDAAGCTAEDEITVSGDPCDNFSVAIDNVQGTTLITVNVGGTAPFTYLWSTGETTGSISAPGSGTYSVTMTDDTGCTAEDIIII